MADSKRSTEGNWRDTRSAAQSLSYLCLAEHLSDISFTFSAIKDVKLPVHKFVLSMRSEVFEAMFYGPLAEGGETVLIEDVEPDVMKTVLRFVYSDDPQIDGNNVLPCLYAAKKYQLSGLVKLCSDFLENNVDVNNVCHINEQATIYQMKTLQDKCIAFIMKNATSVLCSPGVLEFSQSTLLNVLQRDDLACDEMYVFKAARRWAEHNCEVNNKSKTGQNIREQLGEALFEIRFPIMPIEEFARVVTPSGILTNDEIVMLYQFNATKGSSPLGKFSQKQRLGAKIAIELNQDNSNLLKRQNTSMQDEFRAAVERAREIADRINKK